MSERCLICYKNLENSENIYHNACIRKSIVKDIDPIIPFSLDQMNELATKIIQSSISVTGVQPKISLTTYKEAGEKNYKLTLINYKGQFILKPQSKVYPYLPENEDLTMKLAELSKIQTVPYVLAVLKSGEKVYLSKRIDRNESEKIHMEDMCQAMGRMTEHKYRGSVESVGKTVFKYSENKMYDIISFFDVVLFSFLTGNSDMHLKNYSFIYRSGIHLAPAYDLLNTKIVIPEDKEESALTINGKKNNIKKGDFDKLSSFLKIPEKSRDSIYKKYADLKDSFLSLIDISFLPVELKEAYAAYYGEMIKRMKM